MNQAKYWPWPRSRWCKENFAANVNEILPKSGFEPGDKHYYTSKSLVCSQFPEIKRLTMIFSLGIFKFTLISGDAHVEPKTN